MQYLTTASFIKNNENAKNIANISQILFALGRTQDILRHSHLQEHWKFMFYSHLCYIWVKSIRTYVAAPKEPCLFVAMPLF